MPLMRVILAEVADGGGTHCELELVRKYVDGPHLLRKTCLHSPIVHVCV